MFKLLRTNIVRTLTDWKFWMGSAAVCVMLLAAVVKLDINGDSITMIDMIIDKSKMDDDINYNSLEMLAGKDSLWLMMFVPVLTAFAFVPVLNEDLKHRFTRYVMPHVSKKNYFSASYLSAVICGGIMLIIGSLLAELVICLSFPGIQSFSVQDQAGYYEMLEYTAPAWYCKAVKTGSIAAVLLVNAVRYFAYGALAVIPALLISSLSINIYFVISLPFLLCHLWERFIVYLAMNGSKAYITLVNIGYYRLGSTIYQDLDIKGLIRCNVGVFLFSYLVYMLINLGKADTCES
ncbi:MAG: hypothetical protein IJM14_07035 [Lachnospiraceae bacterium]|nr:hypothetical protein [Lachnospiraceae bacterium]